MGEIKKIVTENEESKRIIERLEEENKNLTLELKVASKSDILEEMKVPYNERIIDLKEQINKKEEEVIIIFNERQTDK